MASNKMMLFLAVVALVLALASALPVVQDVEQKAKELAGKMNHGGNNYGPGECPLFYKAPCRLYNQGWNRVGGFRQRLHDQLLCRPPFDYCPDWLLNDRDES